MGSVEKDRVQIRGDSRMKDRVQVGDVVTGPSGDTQWVVTGLRGDKVTVMRDVTDSRGVAWVERREMPRRFVVVVGSQVGMDL